MQHLFFFFGYSQTFINANDTRKKMIQIFLQTFIIETFCYVYSQKKGVFIPIKLFFSLNSSVYKPKYKKKINDVNYAQSRNAIKT